MDKLHVCRFNGVQGSAKGLSKGAAKARFIFAHGAGAGMDNDFMLAVAQGLAARDIEVVRFNFLYMQQVSETGKKRPPDGMPKLLAYYHQMLVEYGGDLPLFIGGKSMGGRVATMLLAEDMADTALVKGVAVLGYPFHPPGKPDKLRVEHLADMACDCLIVQGERDVMGNQIEVSGYDLPAGVKVEFLPDGDHSLKPRKASGLTHQQHIDAACDKVAAFIETNLG